MIMDIIYWWVGFSIVWFLIFVIDLSLLLAAWYLVIAPIQRSANSYIFLTINKNLRHESLTGLSEFSVIVKILKTEFKPFGNTNTSAGNDRYGYKVDRFGIRRFWKV